MGGGPDWGFNQLLLFPVLRGPLPEATFIHRGFCSLQAGQRFLIPASHILQLSPPPRGGFRRGWSHPSMGNVPKGFGASGTYCTPLHTLREADALPSGDSEFRNVAPGWG